MKVIPNEECVKQRHIVICDIIAHATHVKKQQILTSHPHLEAQGQSWRALCWMLPLKSVVYPVETWNLVVKWKDVQEKHAQFKVYNSLMKGGQMAEASPRGKDCLQWCQTHAKACRLADRIWGWERGIDHSIFQMEMVFSVSPNIWTTQPRTLLARIVFTMMVVSFSSLMKGKWWHGLSRVWVAKQWAPWGPFLVRPTPPSPPPQPLPPTPTPTPHPSVYASLIHKALRKMKCGMAVGPSGIITEMLKAVGEEGVELARQLAEAVFGF